MARNLERGILLTSVLGVLNLELTYLKAGKTTQRNGNIIALTAEMAAFRKFTKSHSPRKMTFGSSLVKAS